MASIPLPALATQQQPGPLDQYAKALQIKSLMQGQQLQQQNIQGSQIENQQRQIALQDQQASTAALKEWDGKDVNEVPGLILKHGGSANAVFGAKQQITQMTKAAADAQDAVLKNQSTMNDMIAGHLETVKSAPDKQAAFDSAITDLEQKGYVKPGQIPHQYPGDDQLSLMEKQFMGQKQITDQALESRKTAATETTAAAQQQRSATGQEELNQKLPGGALYAPTIAAATAKAELPLKAATAAAEAQAKQPVDVQTEVAKQQALQKLAPAALANVKPTLVAPAAAAYAKTGDEYAGAVQAAQNMQDFIAAAKSGNKEAVKIVPLQGALEITTAQGVHRINRTEVDNYEGAGSLYDKIAGEVGKVATGKSITDSVLNDMQAMQDVIAKNALQLHQNKVKTINDTYGSNFEPMTFKGGAQGGGQTQPENAPPKLQIGQTVSIHGKPMKVTAVHPDGSFDAQ